MFEVVSLSAEQLFFITESSLAEVARRQSLDDFEKLLDALKKTKCIRVIPDPSEDEKEEFEYPPPPPEEASFFQRLFGK